ncbi:MAG: hypothetical protein GY810_24245 [Aureispira sp.]|nr:hypothetical protein [Aureispira sp.]
MKKYLFFLLTITVLVSSCVKDEDKDKNDDNTTATTAKLKFKFKFDPNQERLDNFGQPSTIPAGNAAQTPDFRGLSAHFIELVKDEFVPVQTGEMVYKGAETTVGGDKAIDFEQAVVEDENIVFLEVPIKDITPGTYKHIRVSVTYQQLDIKYDVINIPGLSQSLSDESGRMDVFVGFNTYLKEVTPIQKTETINANKKQGFWAFETDLKSPYNNYNTLSSGQAPVGATTVVNPFANTAPITEGSCLVSGSFDNALNITGNETEDIEVTLSFSINNSVEWKDTNGNGKMDVDVGNNSVETMVDMGLRGLKAFVN